MRPESKGSSVLPIGERVHALYDTARSLSVFRQCVQRQRWHGEMFGVVGNEDELVVESNCGDHGIGNGECFALVAVVAFEPAGEFGDGKSDGVELQAVQGATVLCSSFGRKPA